MQEWGIPTLLPKRKQPDASPVPWMLTLNEISLYNECRSPYNQEFLYG